MNHKVLFNGDGSMLFRFEGLGDMVPIAEFEKITAERDNALAQNAELAAMVEALRTYLVELKESYCRDPYKSTAAERAADGKLLSVVHEFIKLAPTQHLRDRDAEVIEKAIEAVSHTSNYGEIKMSELFEYAGKVRSGL